MIKKCSGCGITLQDKNVQEIGYTPNINNSLCMRCFKLKNYNELISSGDIINNKILLDSINKYNTFVIYLIDFFNITDETINIYKKINNKKVLVITKSDLIPNNIIKDKVIKNIKDIYKINENIFLVSSKKKSNINILYQLCINNKKVLITGFTNAGKSSIVNVLVNSDITVSNKKNTTLDFIEVKSDLFKIIDAPGFISNTFNNQAKKEIKAITYQMKQNEYLEFKDFNIYFNGQANITIYMDALVQKRKTKANIKYDTPVPSNTDLVIKGLGFIRFSNSAIISINIDKSLYELRPSIIGGNYE